jgi:nifR3 family TIM-barrel protein
MHIGSLDLGERPLMLAPMEDVSDPPFRILCKRYGADVLYTEFISSGGLTHDSDDAQKKLDLYEEERPIGIQVFGGDVEQVRGATQIVDRAGADIIDINFGCPVRKVVRKDGGAGILRKPDKMRRITETVIEEATRPVTVKTRLGWDDDTIDILNIARMLEETGVQALAMHARTRAQMYRGEARWHWLRRLKEEGVRDIPLIGNGDALSPPEVEAMFDETGVDGVMIGRGAIGNPWIFQQAKTYMETGEVPPAPGWEERVEVVAEHLALKCEWLGERTGVLEMRKHYSGYFKGFRNASKLRHALMQETEQDGVREVLLNWDSDAADIRLSKAGLSGREKVQAKGPPSRGDRSAPTKKPEPPPALA